MKSMLSAKSKRYYKNIVLNRGRKRRSTIENIVRKSYEVLPNKYKTMIDDMESIIQATTGIIYASTDRKISPYQAIYQYAKQRGRMNKMGTKYDIWNLFRTDPSTSPVYNKFNSYMYRNGYSASKYFIDNAQIKVERSVVYVTCELPEQTKGIRYDSLEIEYDYSGGEIVAYMTL